MRWLEILVEHTADDAFVTGKSQRIAGPVISIDMCGSYTRGIVPVSRGVLVLVGFIFLLGTVIAFIEVPATQAANQQRADLIGNLSRIGATHIYTDYWTCNALAFTSNERIICGVLDENLQPTHNRAPRYYAIVSADPHTAYVFCMDNQLPSLEHKLQAKGLTYRRYVFDGYVVFQPV